MTSSLRCPHFGTCGGCSKLDVPFQRQLSDKALDLRQLIQGYLDGVRIEFEAPKQTPRHFRNKLLYPVLSDKNCKRRMGLFARGTHELIEVEHCQLQEQALTKIGNQARSLFREFEFEAYDEEDHSGFLRGFQARLMPGSGELLMGIVTRGGTFPEGRKIADRLMKFAERLRTGKGKRLNPVGVLHNINEGAGNAILGPRSNPLVGRDYLEDRVGKLVFRVSFGSFYQVHRAAEHILYRPALDMLGSVEDLEVTDGYGGVGTFAIRLAKMGARSVKIIENNRDACRDAEHNLKKNRCNQVSVQQAAFGAEALKPNLGLLVIDPPRSGLGADGLAVITEAMPRRILYVSCSAKSLARDLGVLIPKGYRLRRVRVADLFPHTDHYETISLLERC